ncbi:hypothetical protein B0H13DRAFT_1892821 [Mycena leptocephala]|nr:hypothetical protein B0H13DRAFT_1892821 [Mycena leptocephala]
MCHRFGGRCCCPAQTQYFQDGRLAYPNTSVDDARSVNNGNLVYFFNQWKKIGRGGVKFYYPHTPAVLSQLEMYASYRRDIAEFYGDDLGILRFVMQYPRPFRECLRACVPSTVFTVEQLPIGRCDQLSPYVVEYVQQAVWEIMRARAMVTGEEFSIDRWFIFSLNLALQLDIHFGMPSTHYPANNRRERALSKVSAALRTANMHCTQATSMGVPLSVHISSLPHVPS